MWRGLAFAWFEKCGSQAEGWECQINTDAGATVIVFSVRENDGIFTAFTTPAFATPCSSPRYVDALESLLRQSIQIVDRQALLLRML